MRRRKNEASRDFWDWKNPAISAMIEASPDADRQLIGGAEERKKKAMHEEDKIWARNVLARITEKMEKVSVRSADKIPYTTENGVHDDWSGDDKIGWWTNGFWGGMMWQMYELTGQERYKAVAESVERKLDRVLMDAQSMDHDSGFKWLPTSVNNYRLTGDPASRNRALLAANNLAGRFNHAGQFIRAWNDWGGNGPDRRGWAIIDCMMNLPLLYWASEETKDPRFAQTAMRHADTAARCFVREDGSVNHIVEFDVDSGEMVRSYGGQGYGDGSSWTRGQAWGLYGFAQSFRHTGKREYLDTAMRIADYFIAHIPESGLIPVDFCQPAEPAWEDSTAAAIAASGLLEIRQLLGEKKKESAGSAENGPGEDGRKYLEAAVRLLRALTERRVNWDDAADNLLEKCTAAYHDKDHEFSIIYGDYYLIEALMKLAL